MIESLTQSLSWIVHPAAGVALGLFATVLFSRRGRQWEAVALSAAILLLLTGLGADWAVHPAAGMLLGYFGSTAFGNWQKRWPTLLVALGASVLFMTSGADWMVFPLAIMFMIWLFTAAFSFVGRAATASRADTSPAGLPEQAGGFSFGSFWTAQKEKETVPATQSQGKVPLSKTAAALAGTDLYTDWMRDTRLPGEARAQLVALNLRTKEALTHLHGLGQQGSEAEYLARAIREEYVPTAVHAYLKLPRTRADTMPIEDGKTGRDLLREQLDLLLDAVQNIIDSTLKAGGRELLTHQRFLEDRFGKAGQTKEQGDLKV